MDPFPDTPAGLLRRTVAHAAWADARLAAALGTLPDPPAPAVARFAHLAGAARLWLARVEGTAAPLAVWPVLAPAEAAGHLAHAHAAFGRLLGAGAHPAGEREANLAAPVAYVNSQGEAHTNTLGDILTHVALHGAHHRGQILADLRAAGHAPPYVDFIGFARAPER